MIIDQDLAADLLGISPEALDANALVFRETPVLPVYTREWIDAVLIASPDRLRGVWVRPKRPVGKWLPVTSLAVWFGLTRSHMYYLTKHMKSRIDYNHPLKRRVFLVTDARDILDSVGFTRGQRSWTFRGTHTP